ncbi:serine hydrolase domain-containing protein [Microbacterium halotolerans]|uniref:serine hydrolase domain-containing protein n=1 Tax=Microbacterium halotolerans TaxID=246613 RepID=UPI000E6AD719|nr:serine hydrolase domain-containing protein [Microbacterium halotolerans]
MRGRTTRRGAAAIAAIVAFGAVLTGCSGGADVVELPEQASAELPAEMTEQIDAAVTKAMQASGATGGIVGVWAPWGGEYVAGLGSTAIEGGEDVTADMTFRIGDVTRAMTCDVLYGLAADGQLEVTDSVTQYVQNLAGSEDITLQQLCDSTSGIGSSEAKVLINWVRTPEREWDPRELAARGLIAAGGTPGAKFRDSDAGYLLLGEALRHATGEAPADLLDEYVTEPYGLGSTFLPSPTAATPGTNYLPGYRSSTEDAENGCTAPTEFSKASSSVGYTDSGVVSTIEDLGRYGQLLALGAAEDDEGRFDHALPVYSDGASWYQYGGGVYQAGPLIGQEGATLGYATSVWADPSSGLTVAVVLNNSRSDSAAAKVGRQIAAIASRAPAADGFEQPEIGLPWSAEGYDKQITDDAICPIGG